MGAFDLLDSIEAGSTAPPPPPDTGSALATQQQSAFALLDKIDAQQRGNAEPSAFALLDKIESQGPVSRIAGAMADQFKETAGATGIGIQPDNPLFPPGSPIAAITKPIYNPLVAAVDVTGAGIQSLIKGISQTLVEFGVSPTGANRFQREINNLMIGMAPNMGGPPVVNVLRPKLQEIISTVPKPERATAMAKLDEIVQKATGETLALKVGETITSGIPEMGATEREVMKAQAADIAATEGVTQPRLDLPLFQKATRAGAELMIETGVPFNANRTIQDQIMELMQSQRINVFQDEFKTILKKYDMSPADFGAGLFGVTGSEAGKTMQALSVVRAKSNQLFGIATPEELGALGAVGIDGPALAKGLFRSLDDTRRAAMVSNLSTAVRNLETQFVNVGADALTQSLNKAILKLYPERIQEANPQRPFGTLMNLFSRTAAGKARDILSIFPKEFDDLYARYSADLGFSQKGGALKEMENAAHTLNIANRAQEEWFRNAVFMAELDRHLEGKGLDLGKMVKNGEIGKIDREDIQGAVAKALDMTWAKNYNPFAKGPEGVAGKFIAFANSIPLVTTVPLPYSRYMVNALQYQFEYNPASLLKLLSKEERGKIAAGDPSMLSKAIIGSAFLYGAYQFRGSDWAGEKWYEVIAPYDITLPGGHVIPKGTIADLRPFGPFAQTVFLADVIKHYNEGTLTNLTAKDIIMGLASVNFRAGAGMYLVDSALQGLQGVEDWDKAVRGIKELAGQTLAGFLQPMQGIRDLYAQFDEWQNNPRGTVFRDTRQNPFIGAFESKTPLGDIEYPESEQTTRGENKRRYMPLLRQLTGINLSEPKNAVEKELDRLGFTPKDILPRSGNPEWDRLVAKEMGPLLETLGNKITVSKQYAEPALQRPGGGVFTAEEYKTAVRATQIEEWHSMLEAVRSLAINKAKVENPEIGVGMSMERLPQHTRQFLQAIYGKRIEEFVPDYFAARPRFPAAPVAR